MKYYLLFLLCCVCWIPSYTQTSFEGTITWAVTVTNTDNRQAAQYQQDITKEDLSEQNETIIELEQQLNDPEMQEILIAHPDVKNKMIKRLRDLKAAQSDPSVATTDYISATTPKSVFPSRILIRMKNQNSLTEMEGGNMGRMIGDILYMQGPNKTYFIKDATETYSVKPSVTSDTSVYITLTRMKDSLIILNYSCVRYIITSTKNNETNISSVWITRDIRNMNRTAFQSLSYGAGNLHNDAFSRMPGIPLRIESYEKGFKMTMEMTEIVAQSIPDTDFSIPITYKEAIFGY